jgi:4-amino-4-deoxy-L-arabinose transferase-like glycosyltransferase
VAAWFWAVYPFAIWRVAFLNKETVLTFLLALYVCLQIRALRNGCWREWTASGVALGLVNLCKPTFLLCPVLLVIFAWKEIPWRRLAIMLAAMALVVAPWIVRNYRLTGAILPVATQNGGMTVFVGNFQPCDGMWETPKRKLWEAEVERIRSENTGASAVELQRAFYRVAWDQVRANPIKAVELYVRKLGRFWFLSSARREPVASLLIQSAYLIMALIGLWRLRPLSAQQRLLPALLLFAMFFHAFGVSELRFSLPVFPLVCVLAAAAFYRQERRTEAILPAAPASE